MCAPLYRLSVQFHGLSLSRQHYFNVFITIVLPFFGIRECRLLLLFFFTIFLSIFALFHINCRISLSISIRYFTEFWLIFYWMYGGEVPTYLCYWLAQSIIMVHFSIFKVLITFSLLHCCVRFWMSLIRFIPRHLMFLLLLEIITF